MREKQRKKHMEMACSSKFNATHNALASFHILNGLLFRWLLSF